MLFHKLDDELLDFSRGRKATLDRNLSQESISFLQLRFHAKTGLFVTPTCIARKITNKKAVHPTGGEYSKYLITCVAQALSHQKGCCLMYL